MGVNQRYNFLKTKPKDIFLVALMKVLRILYIRLIKFSDIRKNLTDEIVNTIFRGKR
jgi:hypothetical protein